MSRLSIRMGALTAPATAAGIALAAAIALGGAAPAAIGPTGLSATEGAAIRNGPAPGTVTAHFASEAEVVQDEPAIDEIALVTVVGCLAEEPGALPWILERATAGVPTEQAFTSEEELARSAGEPLGTLRYRLLGVGEFGVESHAGHRVQVKGLKLRYDGEWRLNITSFQHLAPTCE